MTVILEPGLKALMEKDRTVAVLWSDEEHGQTAMLAKVADGDVETFKGHVPIQTRWELGRFACGSVLRLLLVIFDQPATPYRFETFINVATPEQLVCVNKLLIQKMMQLHLFNSRTEYVLTKIIGNSDRQRHQLRELIVQAEKDREQLGPAWDFDRAKALFQARWPL